MTAIRDFMVVIAMMTIAVGIYSTGNIIALVFSLVLPVFGLIVLLVFIYLLMSDDISDNKKDK